MLLMGDEVRRTQRGNNNAYCQDNEISWFDWELLERHADIHRFVKALTAFRQRRDVVGGGRRAQPEPAAAARRRSHGTVSRSAAGLERDSHSLAFTLRELVRARACTGCSTLTGSR